MKPIHKVTGLLLAGTLTFSTFALTAFAADESPASSLKVTAASNFAPSVTQTFDASANQITTTWWMQDTEDVMINVQGILTYDSTKLKVDMTDGVNRTYDVDNDEYKEHILCVTGSSDTVVNYQPKTIPEGYNAGIRFNATNPDGYSLGSAEKKVPFFSVTFTPVDGAQGDTTVYLDVNYMAVRSEGDKTYHPLIRHSEITDTEANYLPAEPAAVYAGPYDPDHSDVEPTTAEPTTAEPTTAEPTTEEPTTAEPTTAEPTTEEPTTAEPTTEEPTTAEPTTEEPTTAEPTTEEPTTAEPTTEEPTTEEPAPAEDVYVITGGSDWLDGWSPAVDGYVMTKQEDGTYAITVPDVPAGTANYSLKVVKFAGGDEAQKEWIGVNGTDYNCEFMQKSDGDVTVTFVPETKEIKVTGSGVAPAEYPIDKITAVGSGQGGFLYDISWDPDAADNKMDVVSDGVYEIIYDEVAANVEYQVKFAANGGWGMNWGYVPGTEITFGTPIAAQYNANDNIVFTPESENECVEITLTLDLTNWNKVTKEGATYTITVKEIAEPTTAEPTTAEPTTEEPTTAEPTTVEPTTVEPTTVEPTTVEPTTVEPTTEPAPTFLLGDVNNDGKIDVTDATLVQMIAAEILVPTDTQKLAGDVNKDGKVDVSDATLIQMFAAEVIFHF